MVEWILYCSILDKILFEKKKLKSNYTLIKGGKFKMNIIKLTVNYENSKLSRQIMTV